MNHSGTSDQRRLIMVNFDDMTLEELQQLLNVNTKNPDEVKRIQEISGLTGKAVDGIWGKQTSKAWNNFLDKNQSDIEQAIHDEQNFQNAMSRGQSSPAVEDLVNFSNQLDEQQQARNAKIAQLEQQIALVKERIARNERALSGKSYEDVNNKIAALEMKKINSQDPSTIWRWQQQRQDTKDANANTKANAAAQFANTVDMWVNTRPAPTTEGIAQQISNINSAIRDGKNAGADVSRLQTKKEELEALVYGDDNTGSQANYGAGTVTEQKAAELETALTTAKSSAELIKLRNEYKWKPDQLTKLDTKIAELQNKEKANAYERAFQSWVEKKTGKKYNTLTKRMQDTYRRIYKNRGK